MQSLENLHLTDFETGLLCFLISLFKLLLQCFKSPNTGKDYQSLREAIYFRPHYINFKVQDNSSTFQGLTQKFKDFSSTPTKIQDCATLHDMDIVLFKAQNF